LAVAVREGNGGSKSALGVCPLQVQVDAGQLGQQLLGPPPKLLRVLHLQLSPVGAYRKDTKAINITVWFCIIKGGKRVKLLKFFAELCL